MPASVPARRAGRRRYDAWLDWFAASGVVAVGMGLVALFRPLDAATSVTVVAEHVPQAVVQPVGGELPAWVARQRWLARTDDGTLQASPLLRSTGRGADPRRRADPRRADGTDAAWRTASRRLRQATGLCWDVEVDEHIASLVAACDGARPLAAPVAVLAAALGAVHGGGGGGRATGRARPDRARFPGARRAAGRTARRTVRQRVGRGRGGLMRAVVQRVSRASVTVGGGPWVPSATGCSCSSGSRTTTPSSRRGRWRARCTVCGCSPARAASSEHPDAGVLVVSQFTLYGDARKGRRPTWAAAAPGPVAEPLVDAVVEALRGAGARVETGVFGADMRVELVNDGPMTVLLEV